MLRQGRRRLRNRELTILPKLDLNDFISYNCWQPTHTLNHSIEKKTKTYTIRKRLGEHPKTKSRFLLNNSSSATSIKWLFCFKHKRIHRRATSKAPQLFLPPRASSNAIDATKPPSPTRRHRWRRPRRRRSSFPFSHPRCSPCLSPELLSFSSCFWSRTRCTETEKKKWDQRLVLVQVARSGKCRL